MDRLFTKSTSSRWCLLIAATVWIVAGYSSGATTPKPGSKIKIEDVSKKLTSVCHGRRVPLKSIEEVKLMIDLVLSGEGSACSSSYKTAFTELAPILEDDNSKALCGDEKFELIKDYHFRYISPMKEKYSMKEEDTGLPLEVKRRELHADLDDVSQKTDEYGHAIDMPAALNYFFKAFVLQLSGTCKWVLANNYRQASEDFTPHDDDLMKNITLLAAMLAPDWQTNWGSGETNDEGSNGGATTTTIDTTIGAGTDQDSSKGSESPDTGNAPAPDAATLVNALGNELRRSGSKKEKEVERIEQELIFGSLQFLDLVYMPELEGEKVKGDIKRLKRVKILDYREKPEINRLLHACQKRFKPVYSKLIVPIVRLAKLGYEYVGPAIDDLKPVFDDSQMQNYLATTKLCEQYGNYETVDDDCDDEIINKMKPLDYHVRTHSRFDEEMWIQGDRQLETELERTNKYRAKGLEKIMYDTARATRRLLSALNPRKSRLYRRYEGPIGNILNTISIMSNSASIGLSAISLGGGGGR